MSLNGHTSLAPKEASGPGWTAIFYLSLVAFYFLTLAAVYGCKAATTNT